MMMVQNTVPAACAQCGHQHSGPALGGICIGCPCSANVCDVTGALPGRPGPSGGDDQAAAAHCPADSALAFEGLAEATGCGCGHATESVGKPVLGGLDITDPGRRQDPGRTSAPRYLTRACVVRQA